jgi:hypothetical protein
MAAMDGKGKRGGLAAAIVIIGLLAFVGVACWAVIGSYLEVRASKRVSQERMQRVTRQIEEREAAEATPLTVARPPSGPRRRAR